MGFFKNLVNKVFEKNKDVEKLKDELKEQHSKEDVNSDKFKNIRMVSKIVHLSEKNCLKFKIDTIQFTKTFLMN